MNQSHTPRAPPVSPEEVTISEYEDPNPVDVPSQVRFSANDNVVEFENFDDSEGFRRSFFKKCCPSVTRAIRHSSASKRTYLFLLSSFMTLVCIGLARVFYGISALVNGVIASKLALFASLYTAGICEVITC